eukprot:CAMPEP_0183807642 /NCGR_PEP_ID=MMETSP0803_2-20130417/41807_1 /TAXON_ID=195967 /ORGANISM="Crustomastix stigmata, Strain CCMP3273" /LENGTH=146 /DNA_ID=CAMNT_0026052423 /DNA_START=58 /DNA_END=495 /DNA_ORIENTATION=+
MNAAVAAAATSLGIDPVAERDILWVAEEAAFGQNLPEGWKSSFDEQSQRRFFYDADGNTQWSHPMAALHAQVVWMHKTGLGLAARNARDSPPQQEEVEEMADFLEVGDGDAEAVWDVVRACVSAPLPPGWEEKEDEEGEAVYVHTA